MVLKSARVFCPAASRLQKDSTIKNDAMSRVKTENFAVDFYEISKSKSVNFLQVEDNS